MGFRLELTSGRGAGKSFFFAADSVSIGRHADNDLVVYDTGVSRHHCVVRTGQRGWVITDESSANGTFVNDVMTRRSQLRQGDLVQIGPLVFRFDHRKLSLYPSMQSQQRHVLLVQACLCTLKYTAVLRGCSLDLRVLPDWNCTFLC